MDGQLDDSPESCPSILVPEIRDYRRINDELRYLLDQGHRLVRLSGVESQRLLVSELSGNWQATVLVDGPAGSELAADLDAPGLTVIAPDSADGAGRGLRAGRLVIRGSVSDAVGSGQKGGFLVVFGPAGHRAGLGMEGGSLVLLDRVGRLCGDRQQGGRIFVRHDLLGRFPGRGRRGGRFLDLDPANPRVSLHDPDDLAAFEAALRGLEGEIPAC